MDLDKLLERLNQLEPIVEDCLEINLRKWCIEQAVRLTVTSESPVNLADEILKFITTETKSNVE